MNPRTIERIISEEPPKEEPAEPPAADASAGDETKATKKSEEDDSALLEQEFVANPEYRVKEILDLASWKVQGFVRLECGESQD